MRKIYVLRTIPKQDDSSEFTQDAQRHLWSSLFYYIIWSIQKGGKYTTSSKQVHEFDCGCGHTWDMGNP